MSALFESPAWLAPFLSVASSFYRAGLSADRFLRSRNSRRLPVPVISIGNLTAGGTGKTPLLILCVRALEARGKRAAVLTRGYRGPLRAPASLIVDENNSAAESALSDESALMAANLPRAIFGIGADRIASAEKILARSKPGAFVLDDGFQHWPIARDLDIVCVDATDAWGGGHLIPRGRLREPVGALRRAGLVVLTRCELASARMLDDIAQRIAAEKPDLPVLRGFFTTTLFDWNGAAVAPEKLKGKYALAVSGIGNPGSFELGLSRLGVAVAPMRFPDHHAYVDVDLTEIEKKAAAYKAVIVVTEKDVVKLRRLRWGARPPSGIYIAKINLAFGPEDARRWQSALDVAVSR